LLPAALYKGQGVVENFEAGAWTVRIFTDMAAK
jgi:hypothetical protein